LPLKSDFTSLNNFTSQPIKSNMQTITNLSDFSHKENFNFNKRNQESKNLSQKPCKKRERSKRGRNNSSEILKMYK